jgi:hypothetical protein
MTREEHEAALARIGPERVQAGVERLIQDAVDAGLPRVCSDPLVAAQMAALLQLPLPEGQPKTVIKGAA